MTSRLIPASPAARRRREIRADTALRALRNKTPAEVEAWVEANVTNLAQAKRLLAALAKAVAYLFDERR